MPVYNSRDLIPFVNNLEVRIDGMVESIESWDASKGKIMTSMRDIEGNKSRSSLAMAKADEALQEISSATYDATVGRGSRLKEIIDNLKDEMIEVAENTPGKGGSIDPRIQKEIDNAIASVDGLVEEGIKLDYRLNEIQNLAAQGGEIGGKEIIAPNSYKPENMLTDRFLTIPPQDYFTFIDAEVTVLDSDLNPVVHPSGKVVQGTIDKEGNVQLNILPTKKVQLYYPVETTMGGLPKDVLVMLMDMMVQKNSEQMRAILSFQKEQQELFSEIQSMKGEKWTADFSIMKNHRDIVKESITPKGIHTEVIDGKSYVSFSYNDNEHISHFELEKWDEETKSFVSATDEIIMPTK